MLPGNIAYKNLSAKPYIFRQYMRPKDTCLNGRFRQLYLCLKGMRGSREVDRGSENHKKNIGFPSNTGPDHL